MRSALVIVSMVRDEEDIFEAWIRHHAPVTARFVIVLHRSADGTRAILQRLQKEGFPIVVREDERAAYNQSEVLTREAHAAVRDGETQWILPLDADEFLSSTRPVGGKLSALSQEIVTLLPWRTYVPTPADPTDGTVVTRITHRRAVEPEQFYKCLIPAALLRADPQATILMGSHGVRSHAGELYPGVPAIDAWLAHFPVRSDLQFRRKVTQGLRSHRERADRQPREMFHWEMHLERCNDPAPFTPQELEFIARRYACEGCVAQDGIACFKDPLRPLFLDEDSQWGRTVHAH